MVWCLMCIACRVLLLFVSWVDGCNSLFVARCRSLFVVSFSLFEGDVLLFVAVCRMWLLVACCVLLVVRCLICVASLC